VIENPQAFTLRSRDSARAQFPINSLDWSFSNQAAGVECREATSPKSEASEPTSLFFSRLPSEDRKIRPASRAFRDRCRQGKCQPIPLTLRIGEAAGSTSTLPRVMQPNLVHRCRPGRRVLPGGRKPGPGGKGGQSRASRRRRSRISGIVGRCNLTSRPSSSTQMTSHSPRSKSGGGWVTGCRPHSTHTHRIRPSVNCRNVPW
jgi:hypothetical protein